VSDLRPLIKFYHNCYKKLQENRQFIGRMN